MILLNFKSKIAPAFNSPPSHEEILGGKRSQIYLNVCLIYSHISKKFRHNNNNNNNNIHKKGRTRDKKYDDADDDGDDYVDDDDDTFLKTFLFLKI
jgi:hypothetical protein